jgi:hypothetical protein
VDPEVGIYFLGKYCWLIGLTFVGADALSEGFGDRPVEPKRTRAPKK